MYPHTENWAPAWRGLHHFTLVLSVAATSLLLLFQLSWLDAAFRYPHDLLKRSIGDSHWSAVTTEFYDGVWIRGGSRAWNLLISEAAAGKLRSGCKNDARMASIAQMRVPIKLVAPPPGTAVPAVSLEQRQRQIDEESVLPMGCLLGSENTDEGHAGSTTALFGHVIQIEEWVD